MRFIVLLFFLILNTQTLWSQWSPEQITFNHNDTLRGFLSKQRSAYDVRFYELDIAIDTLHPEIQGQVRIHFDLTEPSESIQIDLFPNMKILQLILNGVKVNYSRKHTAVFVDVSSLACSKSNILQIRYKGIPIEAENPPWNGGFVRTKDKKNRPWIAVACEDIGASSWWPCKDHPSDEADSIYMTFRVPKGLHAISNGQLIRRDTNQQNVDIFHWKVSYPINNYNLSVSIGYYRGFNDLYSYKNTEFSLHHFVLDYNLDTAKKHFAQAKLMLKAFEHYLGPYPFTRDGYGLIETPYVGMEHQSGIAYGNRFMRGYLGGGIPLDMDFDYIILHESAHEYWGNSLSAADYGEYWLHEAFATYMEALYVEYIYGYDDALRYLKFQSKNINNLEPIVGPPGVRFNKFKTSDMYYKGSWLLHTLRQTFENDQKWFNFLRDYYTTHQYGIVGTKDFLNHLNKSTGKNYAPILEHYLYNAQLPVLEYQLVKSKNQKFKIKYRWRSNVKKFNLELKLNPSKKIKPKVDKWKNICLNMHEWKSIQEIENNYLIKLKSIHGSKKQN